MKVDAFALERAFADISGVFLIDALLYAAHRRRRLVILLETWLSQQLPGIRLWKGWRRPKLWFKLGSCYCEHRENAFEFVVSQPQVHVALQLVSACPKLPLFGPTCSPLLA